MKLSIIIPTYNEEEYLPKLLDSIQSQSFSDYEVIVADADSTDNTRAIAESYNFKVIGGGLPAVGRNNGAKAARGEYLLFLDSDVILTDGYLKSAMSEFIEEGLDIAITQIAPISDSKTDKILHDFANFFMRSVESIKPHGAGVYGILIKKSFHDEVNGFDETLDFGEDSDYIKRVGDIGSFKVLREPKLLVSTRRLEKEGIRNLGYKYAKSTLYDFLGKRITAEQLNYTFGYSKGKKILYAVCGEGMGHAIRSAVVIEHLLKDNKVIVFASGRAFDYLSEKFDNVYYIEGFNTVYSENSAKYKDTFVTGIKSLPRDLKNNMRLLYNITKAFKPNIIISDFEFYSSLLSKLMRIPMISLDNMHVITQCEIEIPESRFIEKLAAKGVIRTFIVNPKEYLITTYFYPEIKNKEKVKMFSPILRDEILNLEPKTGEHVLVYQTNSSNIQLISLLKTINEKFIVYGFNLEKKDENIHFKEFNEDQFLKDIESCKAVITNGGFTLIGESLYLRKPVLSIPIKQQFEQVVNAIYLKKLGYGEFCEELTKEMVEEFLSNLDIYRDSLNSYKHEGNQEILEALDHSIEKHSKKYKNTSEVITSGSLAK